MARKMKDSGIEWIGEIPEGWEVIPIKYLARYNYDTLTESCSPDFEFNYIDIGSVTYGKGITTFQKFKFKDSPSRARRVVTPGDILISTVRTYLRAIACVNKSSIPQIASTGFLVLQADSSKLPPQFLMYAVLADSFICNVEAHSVGISYPAINASQIVHFKIPLPPSTEQIPLINYLDNHCSKIDVLLSKIHSSIEEYKKLKQAVITQAVTKGMRGEREMKDSGVEWIGEIPAEWSITKIKSGVTKIGSGKTPSGGAETYTDSGVIFLRSQNVYDCTLNLESPTYISPEVDATMKSTRVLSDDVLLNITGGSIGRCSIVPKTLGLANVNQHVCIIRTNPLIFLPKYMQYFWVSTLGHLAIDLYQTGGNREGMSADAIRNTPIPYAPLNEQKEIADYLDAKCAEIDGLIAKKEQLVKELESYKKSLIYEVVTGKRTV